MSSTPPPRWTFSLYSRNQQIVLLSLVVIVILVFGAAEFWRKEAPYFEPQPDLAQQAALLQAQGTKELAALTNSSDTGVDYFYFDPNTVTEDELQQLGLNAGQARSWIKYRGTSKNRFQKATDIAKLYVLDPEDVEQLLPWVQISDNKNKEQQDQLAVASTVKPERFPFDPNTVTEEELLRLGLQPRQAKGFLKYRGNSVNRFKSADDLDRLYILDEKDRERLKSLVQITAASTEVTTSNDKPRLDRNISSSNPKPALSPASLDINLATATDFQQLRGIGPYWSGRFIKYRRALGGFYSIDQLASTYGFPDSIFQAIRPYLNADTPISQTLAINLLTNEELARHPYINRKLAGVMVKYRRQHGPFNSPEDLSAIRILRAEQRERLTPYLDFRTE
ncbi:MAG: helix-hairpin-helix domain-containing protein [Bacteroidota bacterium]